MPSDKISVYNLADLKNTTDDALTNYLTSLNFHQSHYHTDVRLALGYTAVLIAAATFYFDHKLGFEATKHWTIAAVVTYFALNGAYTLWIWRMERGLVFEGRRDGTALHISSHTEKHVPIYNLSVRSTTLQNSPSSATPQSQPQPKHVNIPFARFYTADGAFVAKPFQQWLASQIDAVGRADPNNVVEEIGRGSGTESGVLRNAQPAEAIKILADVRTGGKGARSRKKA